MGKKNNAKMYDPSIALQLGFDPKTGLPLKMSSGENKLKGDIKKQLRIKDEATAINRFTWYNLPKGLNARLIERILYYKGQGILFYLGEKFYFLPYALAGSIDVYGRYTAVTPLPFNGTVGDGKKENPWIDGLIFEPVYDTIDIADYIEESPEAIQRALEKSCVILRDYSEQISQTTLSRQVLNDPLLDVMSNYIPFLNTALLNSTGVMGMRVNNENEYTNVYAASNALNKAALEGEKYVPIIGNIDFQEMTGGNVGKSEEFLLAMQSLDNYRLELYGLENGGLFQKKAHMLQDEQDMRSTTVNLIMKDSLECRQDFCTIANSIWGLDIWVEATEALLPEDDFVGSGGNQEIISVRKEEGGNSDE